MFAGKRNAIFMKKGEITMNLKIVNGKKFIRSIAFIFAILFGISFMISNQSLSHTEIQYKTIYVAKGDTLWSIAREEQENNPYYQNKSIQNIIVEIKQANHMKNSDLKTHQELRIRE